MSVKKVQADRESRTYFAVKYVTFGALTVTTFILNGKKIGFREALEQFYLLPNIPQDVYIIKMERCTGYKLFVCDLSTEWLPIGDGFYVRDYLEVPIKCVNKNNKKEG